jgi:DNA-directed RNA polymerase specialized sigma24 family protein
VNSIPPSIPADRDCLLAWSRRPDAEHLLPLVHRYLALVHGAALRRTGDAGRAAEVTRAVFLVLARRARRLSRRTSLPGWLYEITALVCRKYRPRIRRPGRSFWKWLRAAPSAGGDASWSALAPQLDAEIDRLPARLRRALVLRVLLGRDAEFYAGSLRVSSRRVEKRVNKALGRVARGLRWRGVRTEVGALENLCRAESRPPGPAGLAEEIVSSIHENLGAPPRLNLARRALRALAFTRWRQRIGWGISVALLMLFAVAGVGCHLAARNGNSRLIATFLEWSVRREGKRVPGLAQPARPWPTNAATASAAGVRTATNFYQTTNIWVAHLEFTRKEWKAVQPERIDPLPHFMQKDGTVLLRNPEARRSGLAGVLGFDFDWVHADFELGGVGFTNVAARFKGNGTYLSSLSGHKRAFKVDLNRFVRGQKLGELAEFNFHNLIDDRSYLSDALAYEFFRAAGVPAPRTAYAWLTATVEGQWQRKPLGLYAMIEPVNETFAADHFGTRKTPVFKPVTYQLFEHLGDDWRDYDAVYDLKTKATDGQKQRVVDFARLVSKADDAEFAARVGDFLDLEEFARFLAGEVILSCYDSFLANGQNYYVYLDPRTDKFGFIPWDLDLAWGGFFLLGSLEERERASIWHPWVGRHLFMERVMAVEEFRRIYRARLDEFSRELFVPERLHRRIDELAAILRPPIAAESDFRLRKFEEAVTGQWSAQPPVFKGMGADRPAHQIKRFIVKRAISVRQQLDGKSTGMILHRGERK